MGASETKQDISFSQYFITNLLRQHILFNKIVAKLPRFLVNPIVKYAVYVEYLIQKHLFKDSHNLHTVTNAKVNKSIRIAPEALDLSKTTQKDRSLRTIVAKTIKKLDSETEMEKLSAVLTRGP